LPASRVDASKVDFPHGWTSQPWHVLREMHSDFVNRALGKPAECEDGGIVVSLG